MNGRFLLDTNIVIAIFAAEPAVLQRVATIDEVFVPAIALEELYLRDAKCRRVPRRTSKASTTSPQRMAILGSDRATARHYGPDLDDLRVKGRPIRKTRSGLPRSLRSTV